MVEVEEPFEKTTFLGEDFRKLFSVCGKKTKNHRNQGLIDKKVNLFFQSLSPLPR
jgi:hypothetical protein